MGIWDDSKISERVDQVLTDCKQAHHLEYVFGGASDTAARFEHLLHEVAHAVSLGFTKFLSSTPAVVASILDRMPDEGRAEEAKVWAIEWILRHRFELPWPFDEMVDHANVQDVEIEDIQDALKLPEIGRLANRTAAEMVRLLGIGHPAQFRTKSLATF